MEGRIQQSVISRLSMKYIPISPRLMACTRHWPRPHERRAGDVPLVEGIPCDDRRKRNGMNEQVRC